MITVSKVLRVYASAGAAGVAPAASLSAEGTLRQPAVYTFERLSVAKRSRLRRRVAYVEDRGSNANRAGQEELPRIGRDRLVDYPRP